MTTETESTACQQASPDNWENLAEIVRSMADAIIIIDEQFNVVWMNNAAEGLFGSTKVGKKCYDTLKRRAGVCEPCAVKQCFEDGNVRSFESQITRSGGNPTICWCTAMVADRNGDGSPRTVVKLLRNVTELKLAQQEIETLKQRVQLLLNTPKGDINTIDNKTAMAPKGRFDLGFDPTIDMFKSSSVTQTAEYRREVIQRYIKHSSTPRRLVKAHSFD